MTSNTCVNKLSFINTPPLFDGIRFELSKARVNIFIQSRNLELWETLINSLFIPTHLVKGEVEDKPNFLWTVKEKRKFKIYFKTKIFLLVVLDDGELLYVYNCNTVKERWDTLEMICGVSPSIKQEEMNTWGKEIEGLFHKFFWNLRNFRSYIRTFVSNKYIRIKNWKPNSIHKSKDGNFHNF